MEFTLIPIGTIHTPFADTEKTPIQSSRTQAHGTAEVAPELGKGLQDIEGFSHLILVYMLDRTAGYELLVKPFLDDVSHGVFATRYPRRPNPIGISIVRLLHRQGNLLEFEGADMLDGTPLLDIKPYIPEFDVRQASGIGWYASRRYP